MSENSTLNWNAAVFTPGAYIRAAATTTTTTTTTTTEQPPPPPPRYDDENTEPTEHSNHYYSLQQDKEHFEEEDDPFDPTITQQQPHHATRNHSQQDQDEQQEDFDDPTDMTAAEMLAAILPHLSAKYIEEQLKRHNYDVSATTIALLTEGAQQDQRGEDGNRRYDDDGYDDDDVKASSQEINTAAAQPCRFFNAGYCARGDSCHFVHDAASANVCTFWLKGECIKGSRCEFLHSLSEDAVTAVADRIERVKLSDKNENSGLPEFVVDDTSHFPGLGPDAATTTRKSRLPLTIVRSVDTRRVYAPRTGDFPSLGEAAAVVKKKSKRRSGETSSSPSTQTGPDSLSLSLSNDTFAIAARLKSKEEISRLNRSSSSRSPNRLLRQSGGKTTTINSSNCSKTIPRYTPVRFPWQSTGSEVGRIYHEARLAAAAHARIRNRCFSAAGRCYLAHDPAGARKYSEEGRYHNEAMHRLHKEAARKIFADRNSRPVPIRGGGSGDRKEEGDAAEDRPVFIDLHALHINEALEILEEQLLELQTEDTPTRPQHHRRKAPKIYLIIGTGHHSSTAAVTHGTITKNKLAMAVTDYLEQEGYTFGDVSTDGLGGMLQVSWST